MQRLRDKVAIVTASTEGIGYAIAERLAREGARVVLSSRKQVNVDRAVAELTSKGYHVTGCVCHVANKDHRQQLYRLAVEKYGGIDILVSNAGINPVYSTFLETDENVWDKIMDVNLKCMFLLSREVVPYLEKRGGGAIVLVTSVAAYKPSELGAYSISKTALVALTKILSQQLGPRNIRVNAIAPGLIKTKLSTALWQNEGLVNKLMSTAAIKRIGRAEECAGAVAFLASEDASYISGETIIINGGDHARL